MAEKMDLECEADEELFVWREKLLMARESDKKLNNFPSRHRSQSAPRGTSDRGRSLSSERKDLPSSQGLQTEEVGRRSRRPSHLDDDVSDKETKDKETGINLNRDRSPLKGKFAETGKKVISKLKSLELSDLTKSESLKSDPPALPSLSHTPSLHSQMRGLLPELCLKTKIKRRAMMR